MPNVYSLDNLRDELEKKYAPVEIDLGKGDPVVLRNLMRLSSTDRKAVMDAVDVVQRPREDDEAQDVEELLTGIKTVLGLVAADGKGKALTDAIGDDLGLAMHLMELWSEATQPGEAQSSPA